MKNISGKRCRENQNIQFMFSNIVVVIEIPFIYEIMWKNVVELGRPQMIIWRMRIARWIPKATKTHTEYVILIYFLVIIHFISPIYKDIKSHKCHRGNP
jgi:hypothetical protein